MEAGLGDATFFITFPCCLHNAFFPHRHEIGSPVHYIKARADLEAPIEVRMCVCVLCAYVCVCVCFGVGVGGYRVKYYHTL
jgi:hypothetical protein